jgi:hypothetical protein
MLFKLVCQGSSWAVQVTFGGETSTYPADAASTCDPFSLLFTGIQGPCGAFDLLVTTDLTPCGTSSSSQPSASSQSQGSASAASQSSGSGLVQTICCANPLPTTLFATIAGSDDTPPFPGCSCLLGTVPLDYTGPNWAGDATFCGKNVHFALVCAPSPGNEWLLTLDWDNGFVTASAPLTCFPVSATFTYPSNSFTELCGGGATVTLTQ